LDEDSGLVISGSREDLGLLGGDDSVARNELGENSTGGLDTKGKRADIDEDDIMSAFSAGENTTLDSSTIGDSLIGVNTLGRLLATEVLLEELLDLGDTGGATNKDDLIDILLLDVGILQHLLNGLHRLPEEVHVKFLELGAGKSLGKVISILETLDFNASGLLAGECPLSLLDFTLELAQSAEVLGDVGTGLLLVGLDKVVHDTVIEIFTTKMGVTGGSQNLEDTIINGEERNIEGSSSEIVDDDLRLLAFLVESVGDGGGGRLVDDT